MSSHSALAGFVWMHWVSTLLALSELAFQKGDYAEARRWFHIAESAPLTRAAQLQVWNAGGALDLVQGRFADAERKLTRVVRDGQQQPELLASALHNLASVELQSGRADAAAAHEQQAIRLWIRLLGDRHENVMRAWIGLSSIQGVQSNWRGAEASLRQALAISESPEALGNLAVVLDQLKRGKEAASIRRRIPQQAKAEPRIDVRALAFENASRGSMRIVVK